MKHSDPDFQIVQILLPIQQLGVLDYLAPKSLALQIGDFVSVPFRSKEAVGIVWSLRDECAFDHAKLKNIGLKLPYRRLGLKFLAFISKVASYNLAPLGSILKMVMPIKVTNKTEYIPSETHYQIKLAELEGSQKEAASLLIDKVKSGKYNVSLLDGVTGSGKTEVYFAVIAGVLTQTSGQVLILLPEIVLTSQLLKRFAERFGVQAAAWHSDVTEKNKRNIWHGVMQGDQRLVIGARSALFLPFKNLSLIIVDEEHESSFKQEEGVLYQGRDMAVLRGYQEDSTVVLASATPSLETINNCKAGKYQRIYLNSRYGVAVMPTITIVDMRSEKKEKTQYVAVDLRRKLASCLASGRQAMLFLNRRGYAPLTLCKGCGYRFSCKHCSSWLVEHKAKNRLECHHCGYHVKLQTSCPECQAEESFIACGPGVEKIAEEVAQFLPQARVLIMTKDTASSAKKAESMVNSILNQEYDIIIGTQMIAKGHHFPNIALVGIVDADIGMSGGDLRAAEKTYQLLHQVGGRAGRAQHLGEVMIQTYYPQNTIMHALASGNREEFIENELANRLAMNMPPFGKCASLILSGTNEDKTRKYAKDLVKLAPISQHVTILGPVPSMVVRIKRQYRYRILIKAERSVNLQKYISAWLADSPKQPSVRTKVDIDPYNFM